MGFWAVVIASVVLVFLWGLFSPRSQWKVLAAWSYRNPQADEPSAFTFGVQRVLSGLGVVFFGAVGMAGIGDYIASFPPPPPALTALQQMWGAAPTPQVVNRIVGPGSAPPASLVEVPITGYQAVDNTDHRPRYLHLLETFTPSGDPSDIGLIGSSPAKDFPALDSAELVVNVRVWADCIPRRAVVVETDTAVQIAAYVGMPNRMDTLAVDHQECDRPPFVQRSLLIPINLVAPLEGRQVQTLDGVPIGQVPEISR